jgi:hypothetical protein
MRRKLNGERGPGLPAGTDTSELEALHVFEKDCDSSRRYKVDIKTLALVELPKPPHLGANNLKK